jgi:hypothetical protein
LLCSEEDPSQCHRHLLIGRVLRDRGVELQHIRGDGRVQAESELSAPRPDEYAQAMLFESPPEERQWRSIRSVSRRRQPLSFSGH